MNLQEFKEKVLAGVTCADENNMTDAEIAIAVKQVELNCKSETFNPDKQYPSTKG
jgi:hypothetical protein